MKSGDGFLKTVCVGGPGEVMPSFSMQMSCFLAAAQPGVDQVGMLSSGRTGVIVLE